MYIVQCRAGQHGRLFLGRIVVYTYLRTPPSISDVQLSAFALFYRHAYYGWYMYMYQIAAAVIGPRRTLHVPAVASPQHVISTHHARNPRPRRAEHILLLNVVIIPPSTLIRLSVVAHPSHNITCNAQ
jgi:hypothetical protein